MLLAEVANPDTDNATQSRKAVFTGDVLIPLLRAEDYDRLRGAKVLIADYHGIWDPVSSST